MSGLEHAGAIASLATAFITLITLIVLIWYTVETYRLRKAAQTQTEIATMPIVSFDIVPFKDYEVYVELPAVRNVGSGPAFDVQFQPVKLEDRSIEFSRIPVLRAGADVRVALTVKIGHREKAIFCKEDIADAIPANLNKTSQSTIQYRNAAGLLYQTTYFFGFSKQDFAFGFVRIERLDSR
jgi:hypothetical protein